MCEYCGCQSFPAIDELTREHDVALDHVRVARQAADHNDADLAVATSRKLTKLLTPHNAVEEEALFPAMAREYPEHVETLRAEHQRIHAALSEIAAGCPLVQDWQTRLRTAVAVLREHIKKEQDGLFPAALSTLDGPHWTALEQIRARVGSALAAEPANQQ